MTADLKAILEEAFAAPKPKRKKEFLKKTGQTQISTISFILSQISYIRKSVWIVSVLFTVFAVISIHYLGQDCIWVTAAMMPFIALCAVTENARSATYGMAELEMASRFSLKSITLARLSAIGLFHFVILCILIPLVGKNALFPIVRIIIYLVVPYLLTSVLGFAAARKVHGKEAVYICMGISVMVSFLNLILKEIVPGIYEKKQFIWWCVFVIYLIVRMWSEYKKAIYQTEELVWN